LRKEVAKFYTTCLSETSWIDLLNINDKVRQSYQYFPIRIREKSRDEIHDRLKKHNVFSRKYFYPLCSDFKHFKLLRSHVPVAEKVSEEILCLPFYGDLTINDIEKICEVIIGV
jgi:dTDP-4-amino-4,6-dideoxygalactose transaminase